MAIGCASDTAREVARATDGTSMSCGLYSNTLPGAVVCLGVQAVNLTAEGIDKISNSTPDSEITESSYWPMEKKSFWGRLFLR
ncbi:MAG: hypothetical protein KBI10_05710 [Syntrophorhabdales bacterium]|nr:hypothetical protein [Syntrophorhabdales bacterium]